eukprot:1178310-Prorocentrum_minimum.AAC.2
MYWFAHGGAAPGARPRQTIGLPRHLVRHAAWCFAASSRGWSSLTGSVSHAARVAGTRTSGCMRRGERAPTN